AIDQGLADGEFTLHYQPVLNSAGEVESLEALIRWIHDDGTVTAPNSFIPFAEQSDLIVKLDCWVLRRVVRQLADWTDHPLFGHLSIAVNVSGRHLGHKHFVDHIKAPLEDLGVDPARLIVEITETALLQDSYDSVRKLNATRALGVRIAIDDFGTGYTGLTHLRTLPIDIIKIDSEFIARVDDSDSQEAILVRLIVETGHLLGAKITAEGVEEPAQVAALEKLGSDKLQGYLFSRPVAAEDLEPVLQRLAQPVEPDQPSKPVSALG
ncbi:MAG: EAL domain-containing protein, partial [Acidimicrobiales bacterium]|nr:EAL domain-containing protein [Acidimicrobiales bacterium]